MCDVYVSLYSPISCVSRIGSFSSSQNEAVSAVVCQGNELVTGCGFQGFQKANDGSCSIGNLNDKNSDRPCNHNFDNPKACLAKSNGGATRPIVIYIYIYMYIIIYSM